MKLPRIVVLDGYTLNPGDLSWRALEMLGNVSVYERTPRSLVIARAADAEILLTNKTELGCAELRALRCLRYIGVLATGFNVVDIETAHTLGIVVTNVPTYGTESVAQFAFALLLELCHRVEHHSEIARSGGWSRSPDWSYFEGPLFELAGRTLGILGFGRIGRRVSVIGDAFGMAILATSRHRSEHPVCRSFRWVDPDTLLRESDVVSLHLPLHRDNTGLINAERLRLMKSSAILINTSRGGLVVEHDLADALNRGQIAGAALDVLTLEPPSPDNILLSARNCIVTPHIAWATREARSRLMDIAVKNLVAFLNGKAMNLV